MRRTMLPVAFLVLAACASPGATAGGPPEDFRLTVESRGAFNPHCDYRLDIDRAGTVAYRITLRGPAPSDRRGTDAVPPDRLERVWRAVVAADLDSIPERIGPHDAGEERGVVEWTVRYAGRERRVVADRAGTPGLDLLLETVFWAVPGRIFKPIAQR